MLRYKEQHSKSKIGEKTKPHDEIEAENARFKEEIEYLRNESAKNMEIINKMKTQNKELKKEIAELKIQAADAETWKLKYE